MITSQDIQVLLNKGIEYKKECIALIKEILKQFQATDEMHSLVFDARNGQAPQFVATNCVLDDGKEVYVSELWLDERGDIRAGYMSVDEGEEEYDVLLEDESGADYEDILSWLRNQL